MININQSSITDIIVAANIWLRTCTHHDKEALIFRELLIGLAGWGELDVSRIRYLSPLRRDWLATLITNFDSISESELVLAAGGLAQTEKKVAKAL